MIAPTLVPILLATGAAMALRVALWGGRRTALQALAELGLFVAVYGVMALRSEQSLLAELLGAVMRRPDRVAVGRER